MPEPKEITINAYPVGIIAVSMRRSIIDMMEADQLICNESELSGVKSVVTTTNKDVTASKTIDYKQLNLEDALALTESFGTYYMPIIEAGHTLIILSFSKAIAKNITKAISKHFGDTIIACMMAEDSGQGYVLNRDNSTYFLNGKRIKDKNKLDVIKMISCG